MPLTAPEARDLLDVVDDRCTTRATLISSQLPVENRHGTMAGPTVADAILDRLVPQRLRARSRRGVDEEGETGEHD